MVTQISSSADFDKAIQADKLVVVDFFATWCGPCKMIAPMLEKFAAEYSSADFYKLDVDEVPEVAQKSEVSAMPTIVLFKSGKVVDKIVGANPALIKQKIAANA
ncbi:LANO_0E16270g1_1 [Lachancea nothofagi CBS 11611]|uniref:Thioredoxin n=1 Tax=Lachancea nothofagi CBS 11611 TaxID=1266666 RepID=A0A1G4K1T3_9SACH|nr:LANO_0E16270g1_1 [Lachancea nothofagi CBS 11611]